MTDLINIYLNKRSEDLMVGRMPKNTTLMEEIFKFNPMNLESASSADLSKYAIGLAQFLIYFQSQINMTKVKLTQKSRIIETKMLTSEVKGRTKAEKYNNLMEQYPELKQLEEDIEAYECELKMTDNLEKYYMELINTIKRELTRRETEHKLVRDERRL